MNYFQIRYYFYTLLTITLTTYFISYILRSKMQEQISLLTDYIQTQKIFDITFVKNSYSEFQDNSTVKKYLSNYNHLLSKKEKGTITSLESELLSTLTKDIELLKISFLIPIALDNKHFFEEELITNIETFLKNIKAIRFFKILKILLTIPCIFLFIKIVS